MTKKTFVTFSHKSKELYQEENWRSCTPQAISMLRKGQINSGWQKNI